MNVYKYNRVFMYIYDISDNARKKIARVSKTSYCIYHITFINTRIYKYIFVKYFIYIYECI